MAAVFWRPMSSDDEPDFIGRLVGTRSASAAVVAVDLAAPIVADGCRECLQGGEFKARVAVVPIGRLQGHTYEELRLFFADARCLTSRNHLVGLMAAEPWPSPVGGACKATVWQRFGLAVGRCRCTGPHGTSSSPRQDSLWYLAAGITQQHSMHSFGLQMHCPPSLPPDHSHQSPIESGFGAHDEVHRPAPLHHSGGRTDGSEQRKSWRRLRASP